MDQPPRPGGRLYAPLIGASARSAGRHSYKLEENFFSYFRTTMIEQGLAAFEC
jgi:hypothetical protein